MQPLKVKLIRQVPRSIVPAVGPVPAPVGTASNIPTHPIDVRLFDAGYYLRQNPDIAAKGLDPLSHFLAAGFQESRNPSAWFSFRFYLAQNPDVAASGMHPLAHYCSHGWREGRDPADSFSLAKYLNAYPDVRTADMDPLLHFMLYGQTDGRVAFHV